MEPQYIAVIIQTLVIIFAIGMSFVRSRERIVVLETRVDHLEQTVNTLFTKVDGISRHVAAQGAQQD